MLTKFLIVALAAVSSSANAATYSAIGTVAAISSLDRTAWGANTDSVTINGFSSAGACATNNGLIGVVLRDDEGGKRQMAILLAAKMTGQRVNIRVDDAQRNSYGYCYLQVLEFN